jgi:hypothetical protein
VLKSITRRIEEGQEAKPMNTTFIEVGQKTPPDNEFSGGQREFLHPVHDRYRCSALPVVLHPFTSRLYLSG